MTMHHYHFLWPVYSHMEACHLIIVNELLIFLDFGNVTIQLENHNSSYNVFLTFYPWKCVKNSHLMEDNLCIMSWVSPMVLTLNKNGKLRVCVNYKVLNKITKKDWYPLPFCEEILKEVEGHKMLWSNFLSLHSQFYEITIFESTYVTGERKMQV